MSEGGSGRGQGTSAEYEITDGHCVSPPGNLTKGKDLEEDRRDGGKTNRGDGGSIPPTAVSKLRQFRSHHICPCLSEETLKAGGPFYLVSVPGK